MYFSSGAGGSHDDNDSSTFYHSTTESLGGGGEMDTFSYSTTMSTAAKDGPSSSPPVPTSIKTTTTTATTNNNVQHETGLLKATIVALYDMPYTADPPSAVTITSCGYTVTSGPPLARSKTGNSYRFSPPSSTAAAAKTAAAAAAAAVSSSTSSILSINTSTSTISSISSTAADARGGGGGGRRGGGGGGDGGGNKKSFFSSTLISSSFSNNNKNKNMQRQSKKSNNNINNILQLEHPLPQLYESQLTIRVLSTSFNPNHNLLVQYEVKNLLPINQSILLNLPLQSMNISSSFKSGGNTTPITTNSSTTPATTTGISTRTGTPPIPSIRIKLQLSGPYRPEIVLFLRLLQSWITMIDFIEDTITGYSSSMFFLLPIITGGGDRGQNHAVSFFLQLFATLWKKMIVSHYWLVLLPILLCILILISPILLIVLPLLVVGMIVLGWMLLVVGILYANTRHGRLILWESIYIPLIQPLLVTPPFQQLLFQTGQNRPSPIEVINQIFITMGIVVVVGGG